MREKLKKILSSNYLTSTEMTRGARNDNDVLFISSTLAVLNAGLSTGLKTRFWERSRKNE
jgi:hypothetical protein